MAIVMLDGFDHYGADDLHRLNCYKTWEAMEIERRRYRFKERAVNARHRKARKGKRKLVMK